MNTEKESKRWHRGIYDGLKYGVKAHDPRKIRDYVRVFDKGFSEWYSADDHYYDVPVLICFALAYIVSKATELWVIVNVLQYLGVSPEEARKVFGVFFG